MKHIRPPEYLQNLIFVDFVRVASQKAAILWQLHGHR